MLRDEERPFANLARGRFFILRWRGRLNLLDFELAHESYIEKHIALRNGERKGRLLRGHNYAEKLFLQNVWYPLF